MGKKWVQRSISLALKGILLVAALIFLFKRFDTQTLLEAFQQPLHYPWVIGISFLILWFLNLYIDALFWTRIHSMLEDVKVMRGFKINLICYTLSFITPANSGEWAGRYVMMSEQQNRKKSFFLNFWMHLPRLFSKLLISGLAGSILIYLLGMASFGQAIGLGLSFTIITMTVYLLFKRLQKWLHLRNIGSFRLENYMLKGRPGIREKLTFLFLATWKFITYNLQFALIILLFSPDGLPLVFWFTVPVYYLISSLLPSIAAADFVLKSAVAIWIFEPIWNNESLLILASITIWFFNVVIPSFAGLYVIIKTNLFRSFKKKFSRGILSGL
ncbi:MAG: lysylphosphatidylglycerol synthase domain-containing protein [Owenweeksia sp.]